RYLAPRQPARRTHGVALAGRRVRVPRTDAAVCHGVPAGAPGGTQRDRPLARAVGAGPGFARAAPGGAWPGGPADRLGRRVHGRQEARPDRLSRRLGLRPNLCEVYVPATNRPPSVSRAAGDGGTHGPAQPPGTAGFWGSARAKTAAAAPDPPGDLRAGAA